MFEEFLQNENSWLNGRGPLSGIVFSSRLRLARNIGSYPFPGIMNLGQKDKFLREAEEAHAAFKALKKSRFFRVDDLAELDKQFLLERHIISQEHASSGKGRGLIVSDDERVSVMLNEEDHLRIQVINSGFDLNSCWQVLNAIDDELNSCFSFAFMPALGYLTSCPTNVGTALRASCMMHLPALTLTKRINKILEFLAKISFTTRGFFGEGTEAVGDFFQISNQVTLGLSEQEIVANLFAVVNQVKEQEIEARSNLLEKYNHTLEDNVWRSLGILRNCRLINTKEALSHLSMLSLGVDLGIIKQVSRELVSNLFMVIQPAHMQKLQGKSLKESERDYMRAQILREKLA